MTENENGPDDQLPGDEAATEATAQLNEAPEGLLGKVAGMLPEGALQKAASLLDRDGDGNPLNDIAGLAGHLTGRD
jgi:hypothetical protein